MAKRFDLTAVTVGAKRAPHESTSGIAERVNQIRELVGQTGIEPLPNKGVPRRRITAEMSPNEHRLESANGSGVCLVRCFPSALLTAPRLQPRKPPRDPCPSQYRARCRQVPTACGRPIALVGRYVVMTRMLNTLPSMRLHTLSDALAGRKRNELVVASVAPPN